MNFVTPDHNEQIINPWSIEVNWGAYVGWANKKGTVNELLRWNIRGYSKIATKIGKIFSYVQLLAVNFQLSKFVLSKVVKEVRPFHDFCPIILMWCHCTRLWQPHRKPSCFHFGSLSSKIIEIPSFHSRPGTKILQNKWLGFFIVLAKFICRERG